jgi:hypothetical protein
LASIISKVKAYQQAGAKLSKPDFLLCEIRRVVYALNCWTGASFTLPER